MKGRAGTCLETSLTVMQLRLEQHSHGTKWLKGAYRLSTQLMIFNKIFAASGILWSRLLVWVFRSKRDQNWEINISNFRSVCILKLSPTNKCLCRSPQQATGSALYLFCNHFAAALHSSSIELKLTISNIRSLARGFGAANFESRWRPKNPPRKQRATASRPVYLLIES